jgi:hypothetical protein
MAADAAATAIADSSKNENTGTSINGPLYRTSTPGNFSNDNNTQSLEFNGVNRIAEILRSGPFQGDLRHQ